MNPKLFAASAILGVLTLAQTSSTPTVREVSTEFPPRIVRVESRLYEFTFDSEGRLVFCQHGDRQISRSEKDGSRTIMVDNYQGKRLNSPNDPVFFGSCRFV